MEENSRIFQQPRPIKWFQTANYVGPHNSIVGYKCGLNSNSTEVSKVGSNQVNLVSQNFSELTRNQQALPLPTNPNRTLGIRRNVPTNPPVAISRKKIVNGKTPGPKNGLTSLIGKYFPRGLGKPATCTNGRVTNYKNRILPVHTGGNTVTNTKSRGEKPAENQENKILKICFIRTGLVVM